jgi:hypothetical protein
MSQQGEFRMARHFPSLAGEREIHFYEHMFGEDVRNGLVPWRLANDGTASAKLQGESSQVERARFVLSSLGARHEHDTSSLVFESLQAVGEALSWSGVAHYAIWRLEDGNFELDRFTHRRLVRLPGAYFQFVPAGDLELWKKRVFVVPGRDVWKIGMPSALGGARGYRRLLRRLRYCDHLGPMWWRQELEAGTADPGFGLAEYSKNADLRVRRLTAFWGWTARDMSQKHSTEFYTFHCLLRFRYCQALIREHMVAEVNKLFKHLGISCTLSITGLPKPNDILLLQERMSKGEITMGEALQQSSVQ